MQNENKNIIPIKLLPLDLGCLISVDAKIGRFNAKLIIDTGASQSVFDINNKAFALNNFTIIDDAIKSSGINSKIPEIHNSYINSFKLGNLHLKNFPALFIPFSHINETFKSMKVKPITGILGGDFLTDYHAIIDYKKLELHLRIK